MRKTNPVPEETFAKVDNPDDLEGSDHNRTQGEPGSLVEKDSPDDFDAVNSPWKLPDF